MSFNAIQILLVAVWSFIVAIDQFDLLESLYQPIVTGAVIGAILGDLQTGLIVGGTYQLMTIGNMPVGGAQPPNAVIGGIMATVFAISSGLDTSAAVGLLFAIVCVAGLLGGSALGETLTAISEKYAWIMTGLSTAGGMMRFVGFAILLRIMLSNDLWGIYFAGFTLATIIGYIPDLSGSALLLVAFVGIAIALYDFQTRVAIKQNAGNGGNGGEEDGI